MGDHRDTKGHAVVEFTTDTPSDSDDSSAWETHHDMCGCDLCEDPAYWEHSKEDVAYYYAVGLEYDQSIGWHEAPLVYNIADQTCKGVVFSDGTDGD